MVWFGGAVKVDRKVEITDEESALAWLETQDHHTQVWFASRCALRALPALGDWSDATKSGLAFATLRTALISDSASACRPEMMTSFRRAARAAISATRSVNSAETGTRSADLAAMSARSAALCAVSAALSAHSAARSAVSASLSACSTEPTALSVIVSPMSQDASDLTIDSPLWPDKFLPDALRDDWDALIQQWKEDDADWSFWVEWYEAILNGTPMPWELTHRIALEVTEGEWEAGQSVVAERIKEIRREWNKTRGRETQQPMPGPSLAQKQTAAARVASNRDAIALTVVSLLEQLCAYREHVRGLNRLDSEYRDDLLAFIDALSNKLHELVMMLPEKNEAIEPKHGGAFIHWLQECRALVPGVAKRYVAPENVVEAALPTSIILGCTGVGALIGGPVGAGAGGVVGQLISNQMKPGQAAKVLLENRPDAPESQQ